MPRPSCTLSRACPTPPQSNPPTSAFSAPPREKKAGWETKTFGKVLKIRNGRNQREVESADGEFPIYGSAGNVMGIATDYICEAGTTIIGRKGNINSPIYADTRYWNVDTGFGLAAKAGMDSRFLYFFCLSYDFSAHNRGTTIPSLVKSELLNISIPVPPLDEQQRIVGLLDEAFEGLATAKANAEKNLQNARALFESHLQSVFTQRGPGWRSGSLKFQESLDAESPSTDRAMIRSFTMAHTRSSKRATSATQTTGLLISPRLTANSDWPKAGCGRRELSASLSSGRPSARLPSSTLNPVFPTASSGGQAAL